MIENENHEGFQVLSGEYLASGGSVGLAHHQEMEDVRRNAVAEVNRLEKLEVKAEQRLSARYRDLVLAYARISHCRSGSTAIAELQNQAACAERAWDFAADDRLKIVVRLLSVHRLLADAERRLTQDLANAHQYVAQFMKEER